VICDAEVVLVPDAEDEITRVLEGLNKTGILGNFSVVPGSLTITDIRGNLRVLDNLEYDSCYQ
jgi:hypothetical protein